MRKESPDYFRNLRIFEAMYEQARRLGIFPLHDPLEGIEVDIHLAWALNRGRGAASGDRLMVDAPATRIHETKRTLDGRRQSFDCGLVAVTPRLAIVRFEHPAARSVGGFFFPIGSHTLGFFWAGRHYNLYRFTGPDGAVIAYRFDVVDSVRVTPDHVGYTDLLLDAWLPPGGDPRVEDEDEVAQAEAAGLLTPRRRTIIERTRRLLERHHHRIVTEAERELVNLHAATPAPRTLGSA
jgi:hypothetical protein